MEAASTGEGAVACADVARFGRPFWLLAGCCVVVYGCVLPFNNVASALLQARAIPTRTRTRTRACACACARARARAWRSIARCSSSMVRYGEVW